MITEIDHWVITHATKFAAGGPTVAINLSAMSAGHPSMLDLIERELHHYGRPSPINMNGVPNMVAAVH